MGAVGQYGLAGHGAPQYEHTVERAGALLGVHNVERHIDGGSEVLGSLEVKGAVPRRVDLQGSRSPSSSPQAVSPARSATASQPAASRRPWRDGGLITP
jgi:hypothetical protein